MKTTADYLQVVGQAPTQISPFDTIITKLTSIESKVDEILERIEALEVRVSDMDLDSGDGFERGRFDE